MKISIIGTGQVANILGLELKKAGHEISGVYGRDPKKKLKLARLLQAVSLSGINDFTQFNPDVILIAVNDNAIKSVSNQIKPNKSLVVHMSGSLPISILNKRHKRCGVLYPLQTFSTIGMIDFNKTPFCIEANPEKDIQVLRKLASSLSNSVYIINSQQRLQIHLAAVIANNFTNHLMVIAENILKENNLSFDLLRPIIYTAAQNLQKMSPAVLQTGPAKRGDKIIIRKHITLLKKRPAWKKLYELLSKDIENAGATKAAI